MQGSNTASILEAQKIGTSQTSTTSPLTPVTDPLPMGSQTTASSTSLPKSEQITPQPPTSSGGEKDMLGTILPRAETPALDKAVGDFVVGTAVSAVTGKVASGPIADGLNRVAETLIDKHVPTEAVGEKVNDGLGILGGITHEYKDEDGSKTIITTGAMASDDPIIATFGPDGKIKDVK